MKRTLILATALMFTASLSAVAQGRGRDGVQRNRAIRGPMLGSVQLYNPGALLRHGNDLELTEAQVQELTDLNATLVTSRERGRIAIASQRAQLAEALAADQPDMRAVQAHFDSAQAAASQIEWTAITTTVQAKSVLTDEQQAAVQATRRGRPFGREGPPSARRHRR